MDLSCDNALKKIFIQMHLGHFWNVALMFLMPYATTYLCKTGFSSLVVLKTKYGNKLDGGSDLRKADVHSGRCRDFGSNLCASGCMLRVLLSAHARSELFCYRNTFSGKLILPSYFDQIVEFQIGCAPAFLSLGMTGLNYLLIEMCNSVQNEDEFILPVCPKL